MQQEQRTEKEIAFRSAGRVILASGLFLSNFMLVASFYTI